ncbi:MAG: 30S ribosomal protein S6 [bacterium]|nr:30S ribosomal protein S6 [bacterium]
MSTTEDRGELFVYELGYLLLPSIPEDKLPEAVETLKKIITKAGGKELDSETPYLRELAYSMSKTVGASKYVVNNAYIGWMKFEIEPGQVEGVSSGVKGLAEVLRHLLIKAPRETSFTFAKAREAAMKKAEAESAPEVEEEAVVDDVVSEEDN